MPFRMSWGNIANMKTDAIVNAAYPTLRGGADGVHGEIFSAAGREALEAALAGIGWCDVGEAVVTSGFGLHARHIIHAVGPQWRGGGVGERALLAQTYRRVLSLAEELHARSLSVPLLSTGNFGFPTVAAMDVAVAEIGAFLRGHGEMDIMLVLDECWPHTLPDPMQDKLTRALRERYAEGAPELPLRPVGVRRYGACGEAIHDAPSTDDESPLWKAIVRDAEQRARQRDGANGDAARDVPLADDDESSLWMAAAQDVEQRAMRSDGANGDAPNDVPSTDDDESPTGKAAVQLAKRRAKRRKALETVLDALDRGYALVAKAVSWPFRIAWQGLRAFWRWAGEATCRRKPPPGAGGAASGVGDRTSGAGDRLSGALSRTPPNTPERDSSTPAPMPTASMPRASVLSAPEPPAPVSYEPLPLASIPRASIPPTPESLTSMPLTSVMHEALSLVPISPMPVPHEPLPHDVADGTLLADTQSTTRGGRADHRGAGRQPDCAG